MYYILPVSMVQHAIVDMVHFHYIFSQKQALILIFLHILDHSEFLKLLFLRLAHTILFYFVHHLLHTLLNIRPSLLIYSIVAHKVDFHRFAPTEVRLKRHINFFQLSRVIFVQRKKHFYVDILKSRFVK